jgi:hypothetical protein
MADAVEAPIHALLSSDYTKVSHSNILKVPIDLTSIGLKGKLAYVLENVFSPDECEALIRSVYNLFLHFFLLF